MGNENNLFIQIKKGDKKSFETLFKTYYAALVHFAKSYLSDQDECEEIVQAFFLKLWEDRKKINITISVKSYLFSSIRNRCLNHLKHEKIKQAYESHAIQTHQNEINVSDHFIEPDLMEKINRFINELPPRRKQIFILSREHGLKYREIADELGISIKTVETQMGHALQELRDKLKDYKHILLSWFLSLNIKKVRDNYDLIVSTSNKERNGITE